MATLKELRESRIVKLEKLKALGIDPYPANSRKSINNIDVAQNYETLEGQEVSVTGRIFSFRKHGKLSLWI